MAGFTNTLCIDFVFVHFMRIEVSEIFIGVY